VLSDLSQRESVSKNKIGSVFYGPQCILPSDSCAPHCINRYRDKCLIHWWTSSTWTPEFRVIQSTFELLNHSSFLVFS